MNPFKLFSQKEINYFAFHETIANFNYNPPLIQNNPAIPTLWYSCSSISDKNGNFLFCGNAMCLWDKRILSGSPDTMKNGIIFCGPSAINGVIIIPIPCNDSLFYVFSTNFLGDCIPYELALNMALVNIKGNFGIGEVIKKNVIIIDSVITPLAAIKHSNNKDIWLVCHAGGGYYAPTNRFYSFLIDSNGINTVPIVSSCGFKHRLGSFSGFGWLRFSTDGNLLVKTLPLHSDNQIPRAELFSFNKSSGQIKFLNEINNFPTIVWKSQGEDNFGTGGAAFSPNNRFLYIGFNYESPTHRNDTLNLKYYLYQFDISSGIDYIIENSRVLIDSGKYAMSGDLQNTPNEEIWWQKWHNRLSAIKRPNVKGKGCVLDTSYYYYQLKFSPTNALPNFIQSYVERKIDISGNCQQTSIQFSTNAANPDTLIWDFGDPASGISNISRLIKPTHTYASTGKYTIRLTAYEDRYADIITRQIDIYHVYHINNDTTICEGDSFYTGLRYLQVPGIFTDSFLTTNGCDSLITYQLSLEKKQYAELGNDTSICEGQKLLLNPRIRANSYLWSTGDTSPTISVNSKGKYSVICRDSFCSDTDFINVTVINPPSVDLGPDTGYCKQTSSPIVLDGGIADSYLWIPSGETTRFLTVTDTGFYKVIVADQYNCISSDSIEIRSNCSFVIFIPNSFAPNGINKVFKVYGEDIKSVEIQIFDRWGGLVYEASGGKDISWNGNCRKELCLTGVYYYSINVCSVSRKCLQQTGSVHLIW